MKKFCMDIRTPTFYKILWKVSKILGLIDLESLRKEFLPKLHGKILDIGVGDAQDYQYYSSNAKITVLDFDNRMLGYARKSIPNKKLKNYKFVYGDAQELSMFKSNYFDAIVAVFIYSCSLPEPVAALKEARHVLKKDGQIIIIAHVPSKNMLRRFQQKIEDYFMNILIPPEIIRDVIADLKKAGFTIIEDRVTSWDDVYRFIIAKPKKH